MAASLAAATSGTGAEERAEAAAETVRASEETARAAAGRREGEAEERVARGCLGGAEATEAEWSKQSSLRRQANCTFDPREPNCLHSGFRTGAPNSCGNWRRQAKRT